jgi:hypothetical protein
MLMGCSLDAVTVVGEREIQLGDHWNHATLAFSLPLTHHGSSSRLQLLTTATSAFSPSQQHHSKLNYFRIHFVDNKFGKTIL